MTRKTPETSSRRVFLKLLGVTPAVGWLASACDTGATTAGGGSDASHVDGLTGSDVVASGQDSAMSLDSAAVDIVGDTLALPDGSGDAETSPDAARDVGQVDTHTDGGPQGGPDGDVAGAAGDAALPTDAGPPDAALPEVCTVTGDDAAGPYYLAGPPWTTVIAGPDEPGDRLIVTGLVVDEACVPLPGALVDVWQADATGSYDSSTVTYRLRGQMLANAAGAYAFETIVPGGYAQSGTFRPKHVHFTVSAPSYWPVTTQLYFEGDPYLQPNDPCSTCSSDDETHIRPLLPAPAGKTGYQCGFDVVLKKRTR